MAAIGAVGAASYVLYQKQEEKIRILEKKLEVLTEKVNENDLIGKEIYHYYIRAAIFNQSIMLKIFNCLLF